MGQQRSGLREQGSRAARTAAEEPRPEAETERGAAMAANFMT